MFTRIKRQMSKGSSSSNISSRGLQLGKSSRRSRQKLKAIPELPEDDLEEAFDDPEYHQHQARLTALRERLQRRRRLFRVIHLDIDELGELLQFVHDHENSEGGVEWTSDILYSHVPITFESVGVPESLAAWVLENTILRSLYEYFPSVHSDVQRFEGSGRIFELEWSVAEPEIPDALRELPNLRFVEKELV